MSSADPDRCEDEHSSPAPAPPPAREAPEGACRDAIIITDAQGVITFLNGGAERMLGYMAEELVGQETPLLFHMASEIAEHGAELSRRCGRTIAGFEVLVSEARLGRLAEREWTYVRRDGGRLPVKLGVAALRDAAGEISGFIGVAVDAAERGKAAEELARARDAALEASRAKTAFLANISHEIRTPMNAVIGMTELLLDMDLSPQQREAAQLIRGAGDSLLALIDDILDFAKLESGRMTLERLEFDLRREVAGAVELLAGQARAKGLGLSASVASEVPAQVSGDPAKFRQVLVNLIGNAVKFTEQGAVTVRVLRDSGDEESPAVLAEVCDTGIGVPPEALPRLFTAFTQADAAATRRFGGSGLGLAICRRLVGLMGGEIGAESRPGRGSRFWFRLPLGRSAPVAAPASVSVPPLPSVEGKAAAAPAATAKGRILVAEDNDVNQKLIRMQLQKLGYAFDIFGNGKEALLALERTPYRLVLMDCQMPVLDGYEATGRIRESEGGQGRIPVVAITAEGFDADRRRCLDAGMDDFLSKPFRVAALKALLERWHDPVDRATLAGLREFIGTDDVPAYRDFLEVFLKDARTRLELVRAAIAAGDAKALANEAHSLKGSAGTMGARHLQGLCRRLESLGKAGAADEAGPWFEAAAAESSALAAALEAELAGLP
ncbi:MAG: hypothetical protein A2X36_00980 [Elusimicrobia bacterium GWA2_69_24]|nr:MAG: hypothetical protein A2X36_00980 [Elusimicrobia bacterium GWA2_69_24]HBL17223.1 hypothetical protein [Elusimicrobiota bacterium]